MGAGLVALGSLNATLSLIGIGFIFGGYKSNSKLDKKG